MKVELGRMRAILESNKFILPTPTTMSSFFSQMMMPYCLVIGLPRTSNGTTVKKWPELEGKTGHLLTIHGLHVVQMW